MLLKDVNLRIAVSSKCNMNCVYCEGHLGYKENKPGAMEDFRKKSIQHGDITADILLKIIKLFHDEGFTGISLTGGEPLLNKDWDVIVNESKKIGMTRVELTTNGMLLGRYLEEKGGLPDGLTLIKVSLGTHDPVRFKTVTGGTGDLHKVLEAVKKVRANIRTRANKVLLQSDLGSLAEYLDFCQAAGFHEVSLLDLVFYPNRGGDGEKDFFEAEYVSYPEVKKILVDNFGVNFNDQHKYGHSLTLPNGLNIIMKDSNVAVRGERCQNCPVYCQEGLYTVRIGTDGNITVCPDYRAELDSIDGVRELESGRLSEKIKELAYCYNSSCVNETFGKYLDRHGISIRQRPVGGDLL